MDTIPAMQQIRSSFVPVTPRTDTSLSLLSQTNLVMAFNILQAVGSISRVQLKEIPTRE